MDRLLEAETHTARSLVVRKTERTACTRRVRRKLLVLAATWLEFRAEHPTIEPFALPQTRVWHRCFLARGNRRPTFPALPWAGKGGKG